jgi:hypothetical protein
MYETFIDLDELITRCKDESARKFIQEAVACYRVGAYRSCIVSTWNAVVFDFIHKLRQLEQTGNGEASKILEDFEKKRKNRELKDLWQFESKIPDVAFKDFELITDIERTDITRLLEDRNRCAHPSMISLEEPFEATAELARCHMRSAITHLLQRPPVQGNSAINRIWDDIKSDYFPTDLTSAVRYFQKGLLARPRLSLIKNVVVGLSKSLLKETLSDNERERQFSALNAVNEMHHVEVGQVLTKNLSAIVEDLPDRDWDKLIVYLRKVKIATDHLNEPNRIKAIEFIRSIDVTDNNFHIHYEILVNASHVDFLVEEIKEKMKIVAPSDLLDLHKEFAEGISLFVEEIIKPTIQRRIEEFKTSPSFDSADRNGVNISKIFYLMTVCQKEEALNAFFENDQIHSRRNASSMIKSLFKEDTNNGSNVRSYWHNFCEHLSKHFPNDFSDIRILIIGL